MSEPKLYFRNEDAETCHRLQYHINNAIDDGLEVIELFEAVADKELRKNYVWCTEVQSWENKSECNRSCRFHEQTEGFRFCDHRGKLYIHGEVFKFNCKTRKLMNPEVDFQCYNCKKVFPISEMEKGTKELCIHCAPF